MGKKSCSQGSQKLNKESQDKDKKEVTLKSGDMRSAWKGIKTMTDMPAKRSNCAHTTFG